MSSDNIYKNSLVNDFIAKAYDECIPLFTTLEITQNCQFRCYHCYNFDRTKHSIPPNHEEALKDHEIHMLIDELADLGALWLNFSGGEPLLNPKCISFIEHAKKRNFLVRLKSNGELIDSSMIEKLQTVGLDAIDISLYGFSEKTYESFTGKKSFNKVMNALSLLKSSSLELNVSIILHKDNVKELSEIISFCQKEGVSFQISDELTSRYDGTKSSREKSMTVKQYDELLANEFGSYFYYENKEKALQCGCARVVLGIDFTGNVYPCIGAPLLSGNIRKKSLTEIWKTAPEFRKIRNLVREDFKECSSCDSLEFCNRSSGAIYTNTGNYTGCDDETLVHARLRKKHHKKFSNE